MKEKKVSKVKNTSLDTKVDNLTKTVNGLTKTVNNLTGTFDKFAISVAKGFEATATKDDIKELKKSIDDMDYRLSRIENRHSKRLDVVEDKLLVIYTAFEKQLKIKLPK